WQVDEERTEAVREWMDEMRAALRTDRVSVHSMVDVLSERVEAEREPFSEEEDEEEEGRPRNLITRAQFASALQDLTVLWGGDADAPAVSRALDILRSLFDLLSMAAGWEHEVALPLHMAAALLQPLCQGGANDEEAVAAVLTMCSARECSADAEEEEEEAVTDEAV
ncbi:MAG: hypothetical protein ACK40L_19870, partial [Hydrogenophaga sp.]